MILPFISDRTPQPTQTDKLRVQLNFVTAFCWCKTDSADVFTGALRHWRPRSLHVLYAVLINKPSNCCEDNRKWFIDSYGINVVFVTDYAQLVMCQSVTCFTSSKITFKKKVWITHFNISRCGNLKYWWSNSII